MELLNGFNFARKGRRDTSHKTEIKRAPVSKVSGPGIAFSRKIFGGYDPRDVDPVIDSLLAQIAEYKRRSDLQATEMDGMLHFLDASIIDTINHEW